MVLQVVNDSRITIPGSRSAHDPLLCKEGEGEVEPDLPHLVSPLLHDHDLPHRPTGDVARLSSSRTS